MAATSGGRSNKTSCLKCKILVKNSEKALRCDGFCESWCHIDCASVEEDQYDKINEIKSTILWMCLNCQRHLKNIKNLMNSIGKGTLNIDLEEKLQEIQNTCTIVMENQLHKHNLTYSEIVAKNTRTQNQTKHKINKNDVSHENTIIIKPKEDQNIEYTKKEIFDKINPSAARAPIKYFKATNKGTIVLKSDSPNNAENLFKHASKVLKGKYEIEVRKQENPKLKLTGLNKEYKDEKELINDLRVLNSKIITDSDKMIIKHNRQSKYTKKLTIFVETSGSTFSKLVNQTLDIGWGHCNVYEDLNLRRCYKCCGYGHKTTECKSMEVICPYCGGNHDISKCKKTRKHCVNCNYVKTKYDATRTTDHESDSDDCPIYIKKIRIAQEKINYNAVLK